MNYDLRELYQEVILDHNKRPRNRGRLEAPTSEAEGHNPLCGDQVHVTLLTKDGRVEDIAFEGQGCAISTASASLMTEAVKGKTTEEAEAIFREFGGAIGLPKTAIDQTFATLRRQLPKAAAAIVPPEGEGPDGFVTRFAEIVRNQCLRILGE